MFTKVKRRLKNGNAIKNVGLEVTYYAFKPYPNNTESTHPLLMNFSSRFVNKSKLTEVRVEAFLTKCLRLFTLVSGKQSF